MSDTFTDRHCPTESCPMYLRHRFNEDTSLHCTWCGYEEPPPPSPNPSTHHTCPKQYCYACRVRERDEARAFAIILFQTVSHIGLCAGVDMHQGVIDRYPWLLGSG